MFIARDYSRKEKDDFVLNVAPYIGTNRGATKIYGEDESVIGWIIKPLYE